MPIDSIFFQNFQRTGIFVVHPRGVNQHTKLQVDSSIFNPQMGCFCVQKGTKLQLQNFQMRFLGLLGVIHKNKWHQWIPEQKLVQIHTFLGDIFKFEI